MNPAAFLRLAPIVRAIGTTLTAFFVSETIVKGTQNIEDIWGGSVVNPAILALPEEERVRINLENEKKSKDVTIKTVLASVVIWELGQYLLKRKR